MLTLTLVFWSMVTMVFGCSSPTITSATGTSLHAIAGQWLHGTMLGGVSTLVIILGG